MPEPNNQVRYRFSGRRLSRYSRTVAMAAPPLPAALPRVTRLMALAIKLDRLLQQNRDLDGGELARRGCVSRSRITQILNLVHLAPDIQEQLLRLPAQGKGREVISETSLRRLCGEPHWERQRERFAELLSRR